MTEGFVEYPKWVEHPTEKEGNFPKRVIVKNEKEERDLLGKLDNRKSPPRGWA